MTVFEAMLVLVIIQLLSLSGSGLSQVPPMFLGPGIPCDKLLKNMISPGPVMSFIPDYSPVDMSYWKGPCSKCTGINRLRNRLEELSRRAECDKGKLVEEIGRLRQEVQFSLGATNAIRKRLLAREEEMARLSREMESKISFVERGIVKEMMAVMEKLEALVDCLVSKYKDGGKKEGRN